MNLSVGIDVGKSKLSYCGITTEDNKPVFRGEVSNDTNGAKEIQQTIVKWADNESIDPIRQIIIGMEATSVYHYHIMQYFYNNHDLKDKYRTITVCLNPKASHDFSKVLNTDKTDRIDAEHIALQLRSGIYKPTIDRSEEYLAIQRLTRERSHVVKEMAGAKNHYLNNLYLKINTADSKLPTSVFSTTMMTLLSGEKYSLNQLKNTTIEDLGNIINHLSRGAFKDPEYVAKAVKKSIHDSYELNKTIEYSVDLTLGIYLTQIRMYQAQIKQFEKAIDQLSKTMHEIQCLQSIPGIGAVYSAGIVAEVGQVKRFPNEAGLAKYAGLTWKRNQSGNYDQEEKHLPHNGDQYLRYYLVEAADSVRKHDPVFAAYYAKKFKEVNTHQHHRACILTARKLIRVIYTLLQQNKLYEPASS